MKKFIYTLSFLICLTTASYASSKSIGTKAMQFLKIGVSARALAMGDAHAAIVNNVNSLYWNPAGLNKIEEPQASFMHSNWIEDLTFEQLSFAKRIKYGVIGIMINTLNMGAIEKIDNTGTITGDTYKAGDLAITCGYAREYKKFLLGANLKYLKSSIDKEVATGIALDLGAQYKLEEQNLLLGLVFQNLGTKIKFANEKESIPFNIKLGVGYNTIAYDNKIIFALDINIPSDENIKINIGSEFNYTVNNQLTISPRLGLRTDKNDLKEGFNTLSAGFGITHKNLNFDYAFAPYGELGGTHKISLLFKFNASLQKKLKKQRKNFIKKTTKKRKSKK